MEHRRADEETPGPGGVSPAIFHHVAYSPDPAVIFELLRLLVLLRDRIPRFPC